MQLSVFFFFFFNDTATTEIYTLSLHDALPICDRNRVEVGVAGDRVGFAVFLECNHGRAFLAVRCRDYIQGRRSEEHTSELQSHSDLVCRLLLEKKKKTEVVETTDSVREMTVAR